MAQVTGTQAVTRSPHFERLTPRVSLRGRELFDPHRTTVRKEIKKKAIRNVNMNQSQYQY
jgi:hypothetical protein